MEDDSKIELLLLDYETNVLSIKLIVLEVPIRLELITSSLPRKRSPFELWHHMEQDARFELARNKSPGYKSGAIDHYANPAGADERVRTSTTLI